MTNPGSNSAKKPTSQGMSTALPLGIGLGLIFGIVNGGGQALGIGLAIGTGLGVALGAAWDKDHPQPPERHRSTSRRHCRLDAGHGTPWSKSSPSCGRVRQARDSAANAPLTMEPASRSWAA